LVAADASLLHLGLEKVRADSRRLLCFKETKRELFWRILSPTIGRAKEVNGYPTEFETIGINESYPDILIPQLRSRLDEIAHELDAGWVV